MIGRRFGRLVVERELPRPTGGHDRWSCLCDCGAEKDVDGVHLRRGKIESCRCLQRERTGARATKHGGTGRPEYKVWAGMLDRCRNPNAPKYGYYGGRGISVCDEWKASFEAFFADMGPRPSATHTIDRVNNEGNYEPGNCRWATKSEQAFNRRPRALKAVASCV